MYFPDVTQILKYVAVILVQCIFLWYPFCAHLNRNLGIKRRQFFFQISIRFFLFLL